MAVAVATRERPGFILMEHIFYKSIQLGACISTVAYPVYFGLRRRRIPTMNELAISAGNTR